jgi:hypothetical protein
MPVTRSSAPGRNSRPSVRQRATNRGNTCRLRSETTGRASNARSQCYRAEYRRNQPGKRASENDPLSPRHFLHRRGRSRASDRDGRRRSGIPPRTHRPSNSKRAYTHSIGMRGHPAQRRNSGSRNARQMARCGVKWDSTPVQKITPRESGTNCVLLFTPAVVGSLGPPM